MSVLRRVVKLVVISGFVLIALILLGSLIFESVYPYPSQMKYGVTFSPRYARYLKLDWQKTYIQILDDLKVKNLRIPSYWDELEPQQGKINYGGTDFMLSKAEERGAKVILVLGARQPRWPECHIPAWAESLNVEERQQKTLEFIAKTVERYKNHPEIWAWQVENEPLFPFFGEGCDKPDSNFLKSEVNLVKRLDKRPIILTDSGEFGFWVIPMQLSDIFGISVYRSAYDPLLGYKTYPILPYFYNIRSFLTRNIFAGKNTKTIIAELQAEPWLSLKDPAESLPQRQTESFSVQSFKDNITYAQKTGFDENYLWGVEWWYWMAKQGYPEYLDYAKTIFR